MRERQVKRSIKSRLEERRRSAPLGEIIEKVKHPVGVLLPEKRGGSGFYSSPRVESGGEKSVGSLLTVFAHE